MNIEVVEFYPIERNKNKCLVNGTLRVKLLDLGIEILGITVTSKSKGRYFFSLPGRFGKDHKLGEKVHFPCIVFEDKKKQKLLMNAIQEKGGPFIEARLVDFQPATSIQQHAPKPLNKEGMCDPIVADKNLKEAPLKTAKPLTNVKIPKPFSQLVSLEFQDPPKRTTFARNNSKFGKR